MGTEIYLRVGGVSIDWAKNNAGNDHGYMRHFLDQTPEALHCGSYDVARLELVLDAITIEATQLQQL